MKKILLYNWVQFDDNQMRGGGVSIYLKNIIPEYLNKGYQVFFLSSGDQYSLFTNKIFYEATTNIYQQQGVHSYRIVNSPIVAPAHHSFGKILECRENVPIADAFTKFIKDQGGFDEAHIHNIEGISTKLIDHLKSQFPDTKLIVWFHNYHWICPQIELYKDHQGICTNYHDGMDCFGCLSFIQDSNYIKKAQKVKRLAQQLKLSGTRFEELFYSLFRTAAELFKSVKQTIKFNNAPVSIAWDKKVEQQSAALNDLQSIADLYRQWREINTQRLNDDADIIFAVSDQVKQVMSGYAIDAGKIHSVPLGMDIYKPEAEVLKSARQRWQGQLKIAFFGYPIPSKGLSFFLEAIETLSEEYYSKLSVLIVSQVDDWTKRKIIRLSNKLDVNLLEGYQRHEMSEIAKQVDLGIVPSLWQETYNQVSYELIMLGVPVLISDTVGIKCLVENKNFLFESGNQKSLQAQIVKFINNPELLSSFWGQGVNLPSISQHLDKVINATDSI